MRNNEPLDKDSFEQNIVLNKIIKILRNVECA